MSVDMGKNLEEQWERNAEAFAALINDQGTPHHREILNPCVEQLIGDVEGKKLLDAGCGEGYLSRHYAQRGALVTGVDISKKLIDICKQKSQGLDIDYHVADICRLGSISDGGFDLVLCNLVLLNIPCLGEAISEFYRVLRPDGALVFSVVHPAFNVFGPGEWEMGEKNPDTHRRQGLYFKVDRYAEEMMYERFWKTRDGERFPESISFFHRPISVYYSKLTDARFVVTDLKEPLPASDSPFFEREQRIPFFLVFRAEKRER